MEEQVCILRVLIVLFRIIWNPQVSGLISFLARYYLQFRYHWRCDHKWNSECLFSYLNSESSSRTLNPLSLNILNRGMVSALKSFQIYTHLFLAVHIANVSGFSFVIAHAVIPILQREKHIGVVFFHNADLESWYQAYGEDSCPCHIQYLQGHLVLSLVDNWFHVLWNQLALLQKELFHGIKIPAQDKGYKSLLMGVYFVLHSKT